MKMRHCFAIVVLSIGLVPPPSSAQYQPQQQTPPVMVRWTGALHIDDPKPRGPELNIAMDTMISDEAKQEAETHFISRLHKRLVEKTPVKYLGNLQEALAEEARRHAEKNAGTYVSFERFSKESLTFFIAIAAVQFESLVMNYSDNPSGLQKHLESIKDPIAHISFYMFMLANGFTINSLSKLAKNMDPATKARAMKRYSYNGMAAGALVSGITSDVLTTVKDCSDRMFSTTNVEEDRLKAAAACDSALHTWTVSEKIQQYIPQVITLFASQEIAQFVEIRGKEYISRGTRTQLGRFMGSQAGKVFRMTAFRLGLSLTPGGATVTSFAVLGKIAQFAGFTFVDHLITPYVQKAGANIMKPIEFSSDVKSFNNAVIKAKEKVWMDPSADHDVAESLKSVTETLQSWRQKQLASFYAAHSIWAENTKRVLEQTQATFGFYKTLTDTLYSSMNTEYLINAKIRDPGARVNESYYPFRRLPLYGVALTEKLPEGFNAADMMLDEPADLEQRQLKEIGYARTMMKQEVEATGFTPLESKVIASITESFDSNNPTKIGEALGRMSNIAEDREFATPNLRALITKYWKMLGQPRPILVPGLGFTYAYESNTMNAQTLFTMERPAGAGADSERTSDYLWLQMVCGSTNKFYTNRWGMTPHFIPPKLINANTQVPALCDVVSRPREVDGRGRDQSIIYTQKLTTQDGRNYNGILQVVAKNMRTDILGDVRKESGGSDFGQWWNRNVNTDLVSLFRYFDSEYIEVLAKLTANWRATAPASGKAAAQGRAAKEISVIDNLNMSDYLEKNAIKMLRYELRIYANFLNEVLDGVIPANREAKEPTPAQLFDGKYTDEPRVATILVPQFNNKNADLKLGTGFMMLNPEKPRKVYHGYDELGYMKRLQKGNAPIIVGHQVVMLKEVTEIVESIEARIKMLEAMDVKIDPATGKLKVFNFTDRATAKAAVENSRDAMKKLKDLLSSPLVRAKVPADRLMVTTAALDALGSLSSEVSSLSLAFYAAKYRLEDTYDDVIKDIKGDKSQSETEKRQKGMASRPAF